MFKNLNRTQLILIVPLVFGTLACSVNELQTKKPVESEPTGGLIDVVEQEKANILAFNLSSDEASVLKAQDYCKKGLSKMPNPLAQKEINKLCKDVELEETCHSAEGKPIFHYNRKGSSDKGKKILTISLIHGDEHASGTVSTQWMSRLEGLDPRNSWRVIPIVNPDGWSNNKRYNSKGVDLNRNFPSKDWEELALNWWKTKKNSDPRRYPGPSPASEIETRCLMKHIAEFKPDFIIAIHTPLGLLDFDGPSVRAPASAPLPWQRLGNYPGSLGRYMWKDNQVPVLTIELQAKVGAQRLEEFDRLQDISGTVAIQAGHILNGEKSNN